MAEQPHDSWATDQRCVEAVHQYLRKHFPEHEIHDRRGDFKHIFTLYYSGSSAKLEIMRDFWDENHTPENIATVLDRWALPNNIRAAGNKPVAVWKHGIEK